MFHRSLVSAAILFAACAVQATAADTATSALKACRAVSDDTARLDCFDKLVAGLDADTAAAPAAVPASVTVPAAPVAAPAPATPVAAQQAPAKPETSWYNPSGWLGSDAPKPARPMVGNPADFGGGSLAKSAAEDPGPVPLDHITVPVAKVGKNAIGRFIVTLENGQIWRQIDADTGVAHFHRDRTDTVTITRGFLEAYSLKIEGLSGTYQVKRIK
jgi:hypothetical protein